MIAHNQNQESPGLNIRKRIDKVKSVVRRRKELRRIKSLYLKNSAVVDRDVYYKIRLKGNDLESMKSEEFNQLRKRRPWRENWDGGEFGSHGSISVIGRRKEMEDAVAAEVGFLTKGCKRYDFFGVYDGHGGSRVAQACRHWLHKFVAKRVEEEGEEINWKEVMVAGFKEMDDEVNKNGKAVAAMGSTATVAVVGEEAVVVANCGDSRAVLSRGGVAIPLSIDHKPERADELKRVEDCGGKVINWNGHRVFGVLSTTRSIGDYYLKPFVIPEPEVTVTGRTEMDEFMIIASDGLWDVISNDLACQLARRFLYGHLGPKNSDRATHGQEMNNESPATQAAAALVKLAMARGSKDNISIIVVDLKRLKQCSVETGKCSS
ncbi:probable protein phosphatase 2C 51 [Olea europaea var. sylvestris]|uniref:probable protein phosphatase 2C 51 n=1 Tax=Olea europaea var. sylvestris TaxID=158386 RepID=UPI000C1D2FF5|nr:probable protein phosphatase 2C 51 [Olea europaea var. sylvestris]